MKEKNIRCGGTQKIPFLPDSSVPEVGSPAEVECVPADVGRAVQEALDAQYGNIPVPPRTFTSKPSSVYNTSLEYYLQHLFLKRFGFP